MNHELSISRVKGASKAQNAPFIWQKQSFCFFSKRVSLARATTNNFKQSWKKWKKERKSSFSKVFHINIKKNPQFITVLGQPPTGIQAHRLHKLHLQNCIAGWKLKTPNKKEKKEKDVTISSQQKRFRIVRSSHVAFAWSMVASSQWKSTFEYASLPTIKQN